MDRFKTFLVYLVVLILFRTGFLWAEDVSFFWESYLKGDFRILINSINEIKKRSYQEKMTPELYYLLGMSYLGLGETISARQNFNFILERYPSSDWHELAKISLGDCFFLERDFIRAEEIFNNFIEKNKKSPFLSLAYFRLAEIKYKEGKWEQAKTLYEKIKSLFPSSLEAKLSHEILSSGDFFFTFQVGSFVNRENAEKLLVELKNKGFSAYLIEYVKLGRIYYRVRVGKFISKKEAEVTQKRLLEAGYNPQLYP